MADLPPTAPAAPDGNAPPANPEETATSPPPMTSAQADAILAELKAIKQNLLWVLLLAGFFAARAFFFHY